MPSRQLGAATPRHSFVVPQHKRSSSSASLSDHDTHRNIVLGFAIGGGIAALVAIALLIFILYYRLKASRTSPDDLSSSKLHRFSYRELKLATESFSKDHKLGQGGFGAVYKGILRTGQEVAVKKLDTSSLQGEREFQNEMSVIGKVSSPHIVGLIGFCADRKRRLLVYEYMHNRSLQEALFDDVYPVNLDWNIRFKIILDTAKALAFLHTKCDPAIIHGDVKPSNILLDRNFSARIADFGLARLKTEAKGPEVRSEDIEGQFTVRERIRSERKALEKEKRHRKRDLTSKSRMQDSGESRTIREGEPMPENNAGQDEKSSGAALTSDLLKDTPSESGTSPNIEDPSMTSYTDQQDRQSSDSQEQGQLYGRESVETNEGQKPLQFQEGLVLQVEQVSHVQILTSQKERSVDIESSECNIIQGKEADLSLKSPESNELEWADGNKDAGSVKESPLGHRSTYLSKEEPDGDDKMSFSEGYFDKMSMDSGKDRRVVSVKSKERKWRASFGRDWWWRHEGSGEVNVKDYVMEWMGNDYRRESSRTKEWSWRDDNCQDGMCQDSRKTDSWKEHRMDQSRSSEWWISVHEEAQGVDQPKKKKKKKENKGNDCREWWKEECCAELSDKSKELKKGRERSSSLDWWKDDASEEGSNKSKKGKVSKRHRSKSREWWKEEELGQSKDWKGHERRRDRSISRDWWSGDLLSRGVSSTPSMRGTICYVAPEYGGGGILTEKSDVYSFGVLLLVIVSGRRPLQVMNSPLTEFERANLISWARLLAQSGNVLDLVDSTLNGEYSKERASLCITVALLCLQRLPAVRPAMCEVVKILSGESEVPSLPFEFSPSPPCGGAPFRSRRHLSSERVAIELPLLA